MANIDSPFGFVPVGTSDGSDYHGKLREVEFLDTDDTACFVGDLVKLTGTAGVDGKTPVVTQAEASDSVIGALVSLYPTFEDEGSLTTNYRKASTARKGKVAYGSDVLYAVQEDSVGSTLTAADAGLNADFVVAAGNTITGISAMEIDSDSAATTGTLPLRLRRVDGAIDVELGDNASWVVNINANQDDHGEGV